jgi:hypothetical protein
MDDTLEEREGRGGGYMRYEMQHRKRVVILANVGVWRKSAISRRAEVVAARSECNF